MLNCATVVIQVGIKIDDNLFKLTQYCFYISNNVITRTIGLE